jgi:hypothetical protein
MKQLVYQWKDFQESSYLRIFRISVEEIQVSLKSDNNNGTLHEDLCTFMVITRWILSRMRNVSDKSCRENQNTHFMFNSFFPKIVPFMRQCGKIWYSRTGHRWQYNTAHALCMLDNTSTCRLAVYLGSYWHTLTAPHKYMPSSCISRQLLTQTHSSTQVHAV